MTALRSGSGGPSNGFMSAGVANSPRRSCISAWRPGPFGGVRVAPHPLADGVRPGRRGDDVVCARPYGVAAVAADVQLLVHVMHLDRLGVARNAVPSHAPSAPASRAAVRVRPFPIPP